MPSPAKPGYTRILVQVPNDLHAKADAKRRAERATWARVVATLLSRWSSGEPVEGPIRARRLTPLEVPPTAVPVHASHSRVPGARVVIPPERWQASIVAAVLAGSGKTLPIGLPAIESTDEEVWVAG